MTDWFGMIVSKKKFYDFKQTSFDISAWDVFPAIPKKELKLIKVYKASRWRKAGVQITPKCKISAKKSFFFFLKQTMLDKALYGPEWEKSSWSLPPTHPTKFIMGAQSVFRFVSFSSVVSCFCATTYYELLPQAENGYLVLKMTLECWKWANDWKVKRVASFNILFLLSFLEALNKKMLLMNFRNFFKAVFFSQEGREKNSLFIGCIIDS